MTPQDGVLLVDKPEGVTSHDVVARVRREHGRAVKVGHAGTLDPFATGLLLILLGRATRVQRFLMALPKRYETTAHLGWKSTTGDRDGEITRGQEPPELFHTLGGKAQAPPAFSAVKVGGQRAYALARAGKAVDLPERMITLYRFDLDWHRDDRAHFTIECSAGTYVRSLIADLDDAYCETLRRTAIGHFAVEQAGTFFPLDEAVAFIPEHRLTGDHARQASHGVPVPGEADGTVRLTDDEGLISIAEPTPDGMLKTVVGFRN